mgnify:CR=1 FL=1
MKNIIENNGIEAELSDIKKYADEHLGGKGQGHTITHHDGKKQVWEHTTLSRLKTYLNESTNWKGGSKHVSLTRYSARSGFGLQITQDKPMPGDKVRLKGAYVNMPLKDIPKLIKALQTVFKADPKAQLGNAED